MNAIFLAGDWLATAWIHSMVLSLAALTFARQAGIQRCELREAAWKAALVGGLVTSGLQCAIPRIGWGSVVTLPGAVALTDFVPGNVAAVPPTDSSPVEANGDQLVASPPVMASGFTGRATAPRGLAAARFACVGLAVCFAAGLLIGLIRLVTATLSLWRLAGRAEPSRRADVLAMFGRLRSRLGVRRPVELLVSDDVIGPLATGVVRPRVIVPAMALDGRLDRLQLQGLLAHELAHHARRDPLWALISHLVAHAFWFQPMCHVVRRNLRSDAEYLADALACRALGDGLGLSRCLANMAEWLAARGNTRVEIGAVHLCTPRSTLEQRVESLLANRVRLAPPTRLRRWLVRAAVVQILVLLLAIAPAVKSEMPPVSNPGEFEMNRTLAAVTLATALAVPAITDELRTQAQGQDARESAAEPKVPASVHGFSGEIVGIVVSKDTEGANLVLKVQQVRHVWKNSKAEKPQDLVGSTVKVEKFFGRFLDVLLVVKPGDTVQVEAKHVRGDHLQFLGETFKKVDAVSAPDAPVPDAPVPTTSDQPGADADPRKFPAGLVGFRGMFIGKVVKTDVEKGVLNFEVESVKKVWPQNKAKDPNSSKGKILIVNGIAGKWLDVLLVLKSGDRIEVEAFHNRGEELDFVQEWLKKID